MKKVLALIALALFAIPSQSAEYKWDGNGFVEVTPDVVPPTPVPPRRDPVAVTIPPGYHAHTRTDGTIIVHSDTNLNDPNAHAGVARPWYQTGKPGDTVLVSPDQAAQFGGAQTFAVADCPNGQCPRRVVYSSPGSYSVTDSVKTTYAHSEVSSRRGIFKRIADAFAERRAVRQSRRSGGCP